MKRPIVVFDFDKTLTNTDTLFGYYALVNKNGLKFTFKKLFLLSAAIGYKVGIINNDILKQLGVRLFLYGLSKDWLEEKAKDYAKSIKLNRVYYRNFLNTPRENRMIISASLAIYLKKVFPDEKVVGSELTFNQNKVVGLKKNMFGESKKKYLKEEGVNNIDCLYTDSYSDSPVMEISQKVLLVKEGAIIKELNNNT